MQRLLRFFVKAQRQQKYYVPHHCAKKDTIHQVTTMLATSKKSYFQVIATGTDDLTLYCLSASEGEN